MLESIAGGADARPFVTYHNTLRRNFTLRIATELHLKRMVVGGFERVFELGRIFRNEGVSSRHNPEVSIVIDGENGEVSFEIQGQIGLKVAKYNRKLILFCQTFHALSPHISVHVSGTVPGLRRLRRYDVSV